MSSCASLAPLSYDSLPCLFLCVFMPASLSVLHRGLPHRTAVCSACRLVSNNSFVVLHFFLYSSNTAGFKLTFSKSLHFGSNPHSFPLHTANRIALYSHRTCTMKLRILYILPHFIFNLLKGLIFICAMQERGNAACFRQQSFV